MRINGARWILLVAVGFVIVWPWLRIGAQQPPTEGAASAPLAQEPTGAPPSAARPRAAGSMAELMSKIIYPTSDAVFYIETRSPKTDADWDDLQGKTLMLAESANLLMMPGRARDQDRWMADTKLMLDAGIEAFHAARRHDVAGLVAVNEALYESCVTCHRHYRPNYGRGRGGYDR